MFLLGAQRHSTYKLNILIFIKTRQRTRGKHSHNLEFHFISFLVFIIGCHFWLVFMMLAGFFFWGSVKDMTNTNDECATINCMLLQLYNWRLVLNSLDQHELN